MNFSFKKVLLFFVVIMAILLVAQFLAVGKNRNFSMLEVNYLDIGQGDATLINYLGKYQILIDGGPDGKKLLYELGKVMPWGDKKIEIVILTHPDKDHLAGLIDVFENYEAGLFLDNGHKAETEIFKQLEKQIAQKNVKTGNLFEASQISVGKYLKLAIYRPDEILSSSADRNDQSVVLQMDFGENSFLFTGDAEMNAEDDMIFDGEDIKADWLKVGHHGSKSSTGENFLKAADPKMAIISVGADNRYGHPSEETLQRLEKENIKILRTDEKGSIKVECASPKERCISK